MSIVNVALYMRMSTEKQESSIDSQRNSLMSFAEKKDMSVCAEYVDEGISGRLASRRPAFLQMLEDSRQGLFNAVLVYDSSRFARNLEESIVYKSELKRNGVQLISITEPAADEDTMLISDAMLGAINEMYSRKLSKAVSRGMDYKIQKGYFMHPAPFGYKNQNGLLVSEKAEAEMVRRIFQMFLDAPSYHGIAVTLNSEGILKRSGGKWSSADIKRMLARHTYAGEICSKGIIYAGKHEPIIERQVFDRVQAIISTKSKKRERSESTYKHWLSGIMKCGKCGSGMNHVTDRRGNSSFRCRGNANGQCGYSNYLSAGKAESLFYAAIDLMLDSVSDTEYYKHQEREEAELKSLKAAINTAKARMKRIEEAYENGTDSLAEYSEKKKRAAADLESLTARLFDAEEKEDVKRDPVGFIRKAGEFSAVLEDSSCPTLMKSFAVKSIIEKIVLDKYEGRFEVYYKQLRQLN